MPVPRRRRRSARGTSPVLAGVLALALLALVVVLGVTRGEVPGGHGTRVNAVVTDVRAVAKGSPVRVAGIAVGSVTAVDARGDGTTSVVRMELRDDVPTIRRDATLRIRPRTVREGTFFVDLQPGTPSSPALGEDATLPITRTSSAVQDDRLLDALPGAVRRDLQRTIVGFGDALTDAPSAADRLDLTLVDAPRALRATRTTLDGLRGVRPDDLSALVRSTGALATSLAPRAAELRGAVRALDATTGALTADRDALRGTLRELAPTLDRADAASGRLDAALPGVRRLSRELLPGVSATGPAVDAALPWVAAARRLTAEDGLRRLVAELQPTVPVLARLATEGRRLSPRLDDAAQCLNRVVVPAGNQKIEDGRFTTDRELYKSAFHGLVGLAGEGQNSDGNGPYARVQTGLGPNLLDFGPVGEQGNLLSAAADAPIGVRPVRPSARPPYRDDRSCQEQPVPDANAARSAPGDAAAVVGRANGTAPRGRAAVGASSAADDERLTRGLDEALGALRSTGGDR
ncbi:MlaD family protein [Patulibacter sp.]|uniref:MlaD family protein n=1 Tax=Patulibacter sp. TaxID=1912859 RepID=UPI00272491B6|nr:MlaD family protein [Patulibacter sp.]MDO9408710.1 MlaD family protein [Patulibacter sp.]